MKEVVQKVEGVPCFWLDGHYSAGITAQGSKDTPIMEELDIIHDAGFASAVLLIDDARCFGVEKDYPSLAVFKDKISSLWQNAIVTNADDIIRVYLGSGENVK